MRILRDVATGTAMAILVLLAFTLFLNAWDRTHMHYPAPENESAFLRAYSLKPVVLPYVDPPGGTSDSSGSGGGAGTDRVEHKATFGEYFTMRSEQKGPLMQAVYNNLVLQVRTSGMQILSQSGEVSTGYKVRYRSGNSFGAVVIHPLEPGKVQRNMPLAHGLEDVGVTVDVKEEWFPKGVSAEVAQALP